MEFVNNVPVSAFLQIFCLNIITFPGFQLQILSDFHPKTSFNYFPSAAVDLRVCIKVVGLNDRISSIQRLSSTFHSPS